MRLDHLLFPWFDRSGTRKAPAGFEEPNGSGYEIAPQSTTENLHATYGGRLTVLDVAAEAVRQRESAR